MTTFFGSIQAKSSLKRVASSGGGEWAGPCPFCGGVDRFHVQPSQERWLCRNCTAGKWRSPRQWFEQIGESAENTPTEYRKPEERAKFYSWQSDPEKYVAQFERHPRRYAAWRSYKPFSVALIDKYRLGVGVLPSSQCHNERLVVPIMDGSMIVGLRGRAINCNCPKWLSSGGTSLPMLPLYGLDAAKPGCVIALVENPVDALMMTAKGDMVGAAIYSTSYWRDEWAQAIKAIAPELVLIALDNDLVGNGGASRRAEFIRDYAISRAKPEYHARISRLPRTEDEWSAWMELIKSSGVHVPEPAAQKIQRELKKIGVFSSIMDWGDAEHKMDIGRMLSE